MAGSIQSKPSMQALVLAFGAVVRAAEPRGCTFWVELPLFDVASTTQDVSPGQE